MTVVEDLKVKKTMTATVEARHRVVIEQQSGVTHILFFDLDARSDAPYLAVITLEAMNELLKQWDESE